MITLPYLIVNVVVVGFAVLTALHAARRTERWWLKVAAVVLLLALTVRVDDVIVPAGCVAYWIYEVTDAWRARKRAERVS